MKENIFRGRKAASASLSAFGIEAGFRLNVEVL
jgi:hypothetical protein